MVVEITQFLENVRWLDGRDELKFPVNFGLSTEMIQIYGVSCGNEIYFNLLENAIEQCVQRVLQYLDAMAKRWHLSFQ